MNFNKLIQRKNFRPSLPGRKRMLFSSEGYTDITAETKNHYDKITIDMGTMASVYPSTGRAVCVDSNMPSESGD
jgi:hypothetical protein